MTLQVPDWMSEEAVDTLSRGYLWKGETPRGLWRRISSTAAKILDFPEIEEDLFEAFWKGYIGPSTPVASNFGTNRGLPVSCYAFNVSDSVKSIYSHKKELAALSKYGGGTAGYFGDIRPSGAPISSGGDSIGAVPWMQEYDMTASHVSQGGVRRGSIAMYLPITHPDLPELLRAKDHTKGDPRKFIDSNIGVIAKDRFMENLINDEPNSKKIFGECLKTRMHGTPYVIFIDNVNKANPECYKQRGLEVSTSNLCTEIFLYTDENHTFVCVLSSANLAKYDEWKNWKGKNTGKTVPELLVYLLDAVVEEFIRKAERLSSMGRAVRFAKKSRALGIGTMGLHALYQSRGYSFKSKEARELNIEVHKFINEQTLKASKQMAIDYGEPEWCEGNGIRHTHLTAIAPTRSNSVISGSVSQGIEPIDANYFVAKQSKGTFVRKNPYLENLLESLGKNTDEVWASMLDTQGSVQHLDFLTNKQKEVFKTAREIDQFELIKQASDRQPYVCQGQSLNLFVDPEASAEYITKLHIIAWKAGLKSLYYLKSKNILSKSKKKDDNLSRVKIITKENCPFCVEAKNLLAQMGVSYEETKREEVTDFPFKTVPQIWIDDKHIGGYSELSSYFNFTEAPSPEGETSEYNECIACEG